MERQQFSFGMQFGLMFRYILRHAVLVLLLLLLLAGALYPQILIYRNRMDLDHQILLSVIELIAAGAILYFVWVVIVNHFISYSDFLIHVAKTTKKQKWIREMIEEDKNERLRTSAVDRLSDPEELFSIALRDPSQKMRSLAASNLQDPEKAEAFISLSKDASIRAVAVRHVKNEDMLFELALHDLDDEVRRNAAEKLESTEHLLNLLTATKDSGVWKTCLPRLMKQTIQNEKLPVEIAAKLKSAPLGGEWLKKTVCPYCYFSEFRVDERAGESELVYWASDNVVYESRTINVFVCGRCRNEETRSFFVPLSSFFPDEAD